MSEQKTGAKEATSDEIVDDRGTDQSQGRALLRRLRDQGFDANDEKFAVALGRPEAEVKAWMEEAEAVDDDVIMKARGIAKERGIEVE